MLFNCYLSISSLPIYLIIRQLYSIYLFIIYLFIYIIFHLPSKYYLFTINLLLFIQSEIPPLPPDWPKHQTKTLLEKSSWQSILYQNGKCWGKFNTIYLPTVYRRIHLLVHSIKLITAFVALVKYSSLHEFPYRVMQRKFPMDAIFFHIFIYSPLLIYSFTYWSG